MKKHIFIMMLFALCLTSFQAHAQRYLPGMKGLQVTAGMADGCIGTTTRILLPYRGGVQCLHQERQPLGDWRGVPAQKV